MSAVILAFVLVNLLVLIAVGWMLWVVQAAVLAVTAGIQQQNNLIETLVREIDLLRSRSGLAVVNGNGRRN